MGVGVEFNEKLLMRMTQDSHGKYHFIGDPAEIPAIFEDELQGLRSVSLRNGRIEVTLSRSHGRVPFGAITSVMLRPSKIAVPSG